ncbi:small, acid-soluble spore protein, alpha/beta type [Salinithrix halophila]|uniref:Small, acid-soluble spore protein, alpha/beta type n=1 Tax=Salinithrix halophila TaxID=1485204 RepID=A0ABV8JF86_9BACL
MARRRRRQLLVPEARDGVERLKKQVMSQQSGMAPQDPETMKVEMAREAGIPYQTGYNGDLTTEEAGRLGGPVGGQMVKEMIRMAEEELARRK